MTLLVFNIFDFLSKGYTRRIYRMKRSEEIVLEDGIDTDALEGLEGSAFTFFGEMPGKTSRRLVDGMHSCKASIVKNTGNGTKREVPYGVPSNALAIEAPDVDLDAVSETADAPHVRSYGSRNPHLSMLSIDGHYTLVDKSVASHIVRFANEHPGRSPLGELARINPAISIFYMVNPDSRDLSRRFMRIGAGFAAHLEGEKGFEVYGSRRERAYNRRGYHAQID